MDDPLGEYRKKYHFFLTEFLTGLNEEKGYVIELMRAAMNIKDMQKLTFCISPPSNLSEEEKFQYMVEMDSTFTFALNLIAAQLREVLKLFGKFCKTALYTEFLNKLQSKEAILVKEIEKIVVSYDTPGNIMNDALIPMRNIVFHYDHSKASEWANSTMNDEKERKPREHYIDLENEDFGPGAEYNQQIYSDYIFMPQSAPLRFLENQKLILDLQMKFIHFVVLLSDFLLNRARIQKREYGWFMNYFQGYHKK